MATTSRKPKIVHAWRPDGKGDYVCDWTLYGGQGEYITGSGPQGGQGFRDKSDSKRSIQTVVTLLQVATQTGPGPKPVSDVDAREQRTVWDGSEER